MKENITPQQVLKSDLHISADSDFIHFKFLEQDIQIAIRWEIMKYGFLGDFEVVNKKEFKEYLQELLDDEKEMLENKPQLKKVIEILRFTEDKYILLNNKTGIITASTHNKNYFNMACFDIITNFSNHMTQKEEEFKNSIREFTNDTEQYSDEKIHDMFMQEYLNPVKRNFHNYIIGCEFDFEAFLRK